MQPQNFNEAVIASLKSQNKPKVAKFARMNANDSRALGPAEVAKEEGLPLIMDSVEEVAEAVEDGFTIFRNDGNVVR